MFLLFFYVRPLVSTSRRTSKQTNRPLSTNQEAVRRYIMSSLVECLRQPHRQVRAHRRLKVVTDLCAICVTSPTTTMKSSRLQRLQMMRVPWSLGEKFLTRELLSFNIRYRAYAIFRDLCKICSLVANLIAVLFQCNFVMFCSYSIFPFAQLL